MLSMIDACMWMVSLDKYTKNVRVGMNTKSKLWAALTFI